jgi:hypothetical protein
MKNPFIHLICYDINKGLYDHIPQIGSTILLGDESYKVDNIVYKSMEIDTKLSKEYTTTSIDVIITPEFDW